MSGHLGCVARRENEVLIGVVEFVAEALQREKSLPQRVLDAAPSSVKRGGIEGDFHGVRGTGNPTFILATVTRQRTESRDFWGKSTSAKRAAFRDLGAALALMVMRLLLRAFFTLTLLGGLAFGSYAFGKYVLSSRLFGNKGSNLNRNFGESTLAPVARGSKNRGAQSGGAQTASASVEILPESGAVRPANNDDDAVPTATPRVEAIQNGGNESTVSGFGSTLTPRSNTSDSTPERPRRRRRRRTRPTPAPQTATAIEEPVRQTNSEPEVTIRDDSSVDTSQNAPATQEAPRVERTEPSRETPRDTSNDGDTPRAETPRRRRRTRTRVETSAPRVRERTRVEPRREAPARRIEESPVPRPEGGGGGGGGESPVPVPE